MHVLILGAGALGSLMGARLSKTEVQTTLYSTNEDHTRAILKNGLLVEELDGSTQTFPMTACSTPHAVDKAADVVLVTVKSYATRQAVSSILRCCNRATVFLTLQNGIGNWEQIAQAARPEQALLGTTAQGATLLEPGRIRHGGNGPTFIGERDGPPTARVHDIVKVFMTAGLPTGSSDRMEHLIWEKLMVNVGINAITALTNIRNGVIADLEAGRSLSRIAVLEALQVAQSKGFSLGEEMVERVLNVARATAVNRSSMGQDVDRKKRTEIDAINGAIVQFAEEAGIAVPVNRTLTQLIQVMQSNYLNCSQ